MFIFIVEFNNGKGKFIVANLLFLKAIGWEYSITHPPVLMLRYIDEMRTDRPWHLNAGYQPHWNLNGFRNRVGRYLINF